MSLIEQFQEMPTAKAMREKGAMIFEGGFGVKQLEDGDGHAKSYQILGAFVETSHDAGSNDEQKACPFRVDVTLEQMHEGQLADPSVDLLEPQSARFFSWAASL